MSLVKAKIDFIKRGANDELYTPPEDVKMIIPFIPFGKETKIWECTAIEESEIVKVFRENGNEVITSHIKDNKNFFDYEPETYDIIITNPPYSLKDDFLKRAFELKKPFMFLLPITTLEGKNRSKMFKEYGIQVIIPNTRFNFMKKEGKKGAWFQTSWFCFGLNLENDLNFVDVLS